MKLTCPACNEPLSLAALIEHDAAREAIGIALRMPAPLGKCLLQYLGFFKPAKSVLSLDKVAKLFAEIFPMITTGKVSKNGTIYAAPQEYWAQAIETMMANRAALTLPLKSHGYLISIIAGYAEKVEAKAEKQAEHGRKYGEIKKPEDQKPEDKKPRIAESRTVKSFERKTMPAEVQKTLRKLTGKTNHAE